MDKLISKMKNKIKSSKGMSLGEILAAVLIMLLSTSVLTTTVSLGLKQYINTLSRSEANILSSTLQSIITNELAYTTEIHIDTEADKNVTDFQSQNYAISSTLSIFWTQDDEYGEVMIGKKGDSSKSLKLLGSGSYPNDIGVKFTKITYDESKNLFDVTFEIGRNGQKILTQEFQVINVNKTKNVVS